MRWPLGLVLLALIAAGCGDSGTTPSAPESTTPPPSASTTTQPVVSTTPTVAPPGTTTQPPATEVIELPADGVPAFSLTQVSFGDAAFVQITNIGNGAGDLQGHWLCQRPVYFEIPSVELQPGESVWVAADGGDLQFVGAVVGVVDAKGRIGSLVPDTGEMALYVGNEFNDPGSIVDYVEWGTSGHGRSSVATEAGLWPEGGFVAIPENTIGITATADGDDPSAWAPDIGV